MDTELVERARRGDREAFGLLAVPLGDRLYSVAHRILRDADLAGDAAQQALVNIWRDLPRLRDPARFDAWSYRILVRTCYAERQTARYHAPSLRLIPDREPIGPDDSFGAVLDRDQLERAAQRLSIEHRAVIVLRYYLDLPLAEISSVLSIPVGTVRSRLRYATSGLRAAIDADARGRTKEALR
jgi:RNA polymerase sigma-70 factor (ECF subfamily)